MDRLRRTRRRAAKAAAADLHAATRDRNNHRRVTSQSSGVSSQASVLRRQFSGVSSQASARSFVGSLIRSTQEPHNTISHMASADHATAVTDGGGGPNTLARYTTARNATRSQKPI